MIRATTQKHLATGTQESETYAASEVLHDLESVSNVIKSLPWSDGNPLKRELMSVPTLNVDNQATVCTAPNSVFGKRLRHIGLRHYHITESIRKGEVKVNWVASENNRADVLSKVIESPSVFKKAADKLSGNGHK